MSYRVYDWTIVSQKYKWHYSRGIELDIFIGDLFSSNCFNYLNYDNQYLELIVGNPKCSYGSLDPSLIIHKKIINNKITVYISKGNMYNIKCKTNKQVIKAINRILNLAVFE